MILNGIGRESKNFGLMRLTADGGRAWTEGAKAGEALSGTQRTKPYGACADGPILGAPPLWALRLRLAVRGFRAGYCIRALARQMTSRRGVLPSGKQTDS
jgi:hypothetical protein